MKACKPIITYLPLFFSIMLSSLVSYGKKPLLPEEILGITSFSPKYGMPGTEITIVGTGFSIDKSKNEIKFENIPVTEISSATATELKVKVPETAVSSKISIKVEGKVVQSIEEFGVVVKPI